MYLIDPWEHRSEDAYRAAFFGDRTPGGQAKMDAIYQSVQDRFRGPIEDGRVVVVRARSTDAAEQIPESLDWLYIDGDHTYDAVAADLATYFDRLRLGGVLAGDDYNMVGWWDDGVTRAVDAFAAARELQVEVIGNQFVIVKPLQGGMRGRLDKWTRLGVPTLRRWLPSPIPRQSPRWAIHKTLGGGRLVAVSSLVERCGSYVAGEAPAADDAARRVGRRMRSRQRALPRANRRPAGVDSMDSAPRMDRRRSMRPSHGQSPAEGRGMFDFVTPSSGTSVHAAGGACVRLRLRSRGAQICEKRYHLTTFGCQMNEHDSERMKGMLESLGYTRGARARARRT